MTNDLPLSLLEEFLLLAMNGQTGQFYPMDADVLDRAVASAVLMDLTIRECIDNDLRDMFVVDPSPTGDDILDTVLQRMSAAPVLAPRQTVEWLRELTYESAVFQKRAFSRLEKRGIIRPSAPVFWMFGFGSPPSIDDKKIKEIKTALLGEIFGAKVPPVRAIMLTGLVNSCGLFQYLLSETEARDAGPRIAEISRMDLVSQAAAKGFSENGALSVASGSR